MDGEPCSEGLLGHMPPDAEGWRRWAASSVDKTCIFDKFRRCDSQNLQISQVLTMG